MGSPIAHNHYILRTTIKKHLDFISFIVEVAFFLYNLKLRALLSIPQAHNIIIQPPSDITPVDK